MNADKPVVLIIGAGPAGLTAALELVRRSGYRPIVVEASDAIGGISRTVNYKGYRMDIGGHRFFSKSDWVMNWWQDIMPATGAGEPSGPVEITYRQQHRAVTMTPTSSSNDLVMLIRNRLSRIYYLRKFFDYPISLSASTLLNLGPARVVRIGISYCYATLFPKKPERSLQDFLINRFGDRLYRTFFKDYTEKVWGVPCEKISAEWGAQRIKGLSVIRAVRHALCKPFMGQSVTQKTITTSLIEKFLYPKFGPGQLWEEVARRVEAAGGQILLNHTVSGIIVNSEKIVAVTVRAIDGTEKQFTADHYVSTMPIKDLIAAMRDAPPEEVRNIARELPYRDFVTVGLLVSRMRSNAHSNASQPNECPPDNWIYVQESDVKLGRIQVFNNWSPYLVANPEHIWLGLEYFCQEGDDTWSLSDPAMAELAATELKKIGLISAEDVLDSHVVRVPKTYPAYFGAYGDFDKIRAYTDSIKNLFLVGRNGMHRYNNQDHSMLTAKLAVDAILSGSHDKSAIWSVNVDDDYHEEKQG